MNVDNQQQPHKASSTASSSKTMENLESLLSDLQRTTEVLRRANERTGQEHTLTRTTTTANYSSTQQPKYQRDLSASVATENDDTSGFGYHHYSSRSASQPQQQPQKDTTSTTDHYSSGSRHSSRNELRANKDAANFATVADTMLGSVQADMDKHGIHTIPKGDCAGCGKPVIGQVVIALGKMWHPEHYVCCHCGEEIGHRNFFERAGKAYCEQDYHDLFSPRCAYCNGPIRDRCVTALGKAFHAEHFVCAECGRPFEKNEGFHERDGLAYCKEDFYRMYAPRCQGCKQPITAKFITALGTHWHPECFICQECACSFNGGAAAFFEHNGAPLCEQHYHERRGSLCAHCKCPIAGRCISAMGRRFHPEHFLCFYCRRQLSRGIFKEAGGRAYCHKCYEKCNS